MARVLIVDDDAPIVEALSTLLADQHEVIGHTATAPALEVLRRGLVDVLVLDLRMPEVDGAGFLEQMARLGVRTPVILMTAGTLDDARLDGLAVAAVVQKPFE